MKTLLIISSILFSAASYANLVEEVDKLSPQEAQLFLAKLHAKAIQPLPEGILTKLSISGSFGAQKFESDDFTDNLNSKFDGEEEMERIQRDLEDAKRENDEQK